MENSINKSQFLSANQDLVKSTPFSELENRIHNVRNRIDNICVDICVVNDNLQGPEPVDQPKCAPEDRSALSVLERLRLSVDLLERTTEELSKQRDRIVKIV
jgi:hypothetical protein